MVPIAVGMILGTVISWIIVIRARRREVANKRVAVPLFILCVIMFGAILGIFGLFTASFVPTPHLPVEEKVIVAELIPFDKNNETADLVYGLKHFGGIDVHYRDKDGIIKTSRCCDDRLPVVKTPTEGSPSIIWRKSSGYIGWFAFRFGGIWYELNVPANSVIDPPKEISTEILR